MTDWDSFTAEVESNSNKLGPGCSVGDYLNSLPGDAADSIEAALNRPELTTAAIARAMRKRGSTISEFTVRRHRKRNCSCTTNG